MKKSLKSIVSKFSLTAFALVLMQSLSFASATVPDVYVSRASFSDLSGQQLLETPWFWILIMVIVIVFIAAFFAAGSETKAEEQHTL